MRIADVLVVGAGPAGIAAAAQCARLGLQVRIVDRTGRAGGLVVNGFLVENYPGLEPMPGEALAARLRDHLARFELVVERREVRDLVNDDGVWIVTADREEIAARALVLAVGTKGKPLGAEGEAQARDRVFTELRALLEAVPRPVHVVVVGGGEASLDYALSLAARGASVTLLVRSGALKARGRLAEIVARTPAVEIRLTARVERIVPSDGALAVEVAYLDGARFLGADAVLVAIGRTPALEPIFPSCGHGRPKGRQIEVSPDLFVCGDARSGGLGQIGIAVGDGLEAAGIIAERILRPGDR
ncbi:MAG: NAD(P)/FAD-dependent oxidoreductase [Proteobacteria bacterium]|jgi:thioredoxin reductase|nr:NAD(P)/FAD-dependent oxidoreductase [Pseudomonadota bacterium]